MCGILIDPSVAMLCLHRNRAPAGIASHCSLPPAPAGGAANAEPAEFVQLLAGRPGGAVGCLRAFPERSRCQPWALGLDDSISLLCPGGRARAPFEPRYGAGPLPVPALRPVSSGRSAG